MKHKIAILVVFCGFGGILIVLLLSLLSKDMKERPGSFLRVFPPHVLRQVGQLDLGSNSYYLAGVTSDSIYLGNYLAPLRAVICNIVDMDTTHIKLKIKGIYDQKFWSVRLEVDSPYFLFYDGAVPRIYRGKTRDWKGNRLNYDKEYFLDIEPLGVNSFAIKSLGGETGETVIGRISPCEPHYVFQPNILQKQVDGFFCVDGYLRYDRLQSKLVYLYRYRNEFIVMDSTLNLFYRGHTIDTNSVAKIQVNTIHSANSRVMSAPPFVVNRSCAIWDNWLLVHSALRARNEPEGVLQALSVIDVYELTDGTYAFSFYISNFNRMEKLREFRVIDRSLIALFERHLEVFEMEGRYFSRLPISSTE